MLLLWMCIIIPLNKWEIVVIWCSIYNDEYIKMIIHLYECKISTNISKTKWEEKKEKLKFWPSKCPMSLSISWGQNRRLPRPIFWHLDLKFLVHFWHVFMKNASFHKPLRPFWGIWLRIYIYEINFIPLHNYYTTNNWNHFIHSKFYKSLFINVVLKSCDLPFMWVLSTLHYFKIKPL